MNSHLDIEELYGLIDNKTENSNAAQHLCECDECRALYNELCQMQVSAAELADIEVPSSLVKNVMREVRDIKRTRRIKVLTASLAGIACAFVLTFAFIMGNGFQAMAPDSAADVPNSPSPFTGDSTKSYTEVGTHGVTDSDAVPDSPEAPSTPATPEAPDAPMASDDGIDVDFKVVDGELTEAEIKTYIALVMNGLDVDKESVVVELTVSGNQINCTVRDRESRDALKTLMFVKK